MRILAIDTALTACSACVYDTQEGVLAIESLEMIRGHVEALPPLLERVGARIEGGLARIGRIAVTVGPGSYTGLRVGISAARAVGLAAKAPVVGVSTLSALAAPLIAASEPTIVAAAIDARHGQVFVQVFQPNGRTMIEPRVATIREAARMVGAGPVRLAGNGGPLVAAELWTSGGKALISDGAQSPDIVWVARLGAIADPEAALPKPLYLKGPDAKPQNEARLPRA
jgi:tRNA threonylcarbamoyl adenosine modification protein YeaZ